MGHEDEYSNEEEHPMSVNYQSSMSGNPNMGIPPVNPLFDPLSQFSWQEESSNPLSSPIPPPMSEDPTYKENVDTSDFPISLLQTNKEKSPVQPVDIDSILSNIQFSSPIPEQKEEEQYFSPIPDEVLNKITLKSPLFKQHQRLRTIAMLPNDRFVKGSSGEGVLAIQQALEKLYPNQPIGKYGVYGKETMELVEKFQNDEGLKVDGELGQKTLLALDQYAFPKVKISESGSSVERVEGFDVAEEINRPAKISATSNDLAIAKGEESISHKDQSEDKGIHHNKDVSGVRIYSNPTKSSKLKFTLNYGTDVTLVGEYAYESSWSLIQTSDGREGWINSDYVTQGNIEAAPSLTQSELTMINQNQNNLGDVVQDRYGSSFIQEQDARLIIHAIAFMNEGRAAIYYNEQEQSLSWWENLVLNSTEEEARRIYKSIMIREGMNLLLPSEQLILQMNEAGLISSGSINDKVQGAIDFLKMMGGFTVGVLEGLFEGLKGTLEAVPELLKMIWDVFKALLSGQLVAKLNEILSAIWEFISNLPQNAEKWWQELKQRSPFEQGQMLGNGVGMIAFEVILAILTGGAANAAKTAGIGAKIASASSKIKKTVVGFGEQVKDGAKRLVNDISDEVMPLGLEVVTPDGRRMTIKRNDLMDNDRSNTMKMEGDKDGGGGKTPNKVDAVKKLMSKSPDWVKSNEELMEKLVGKSESFIAKVDDFYGVTMNKSTPAGFKGAGTYNGIEYNKYGFPLLKDKNPFGDDYIFKKAKGNHTSDFSDAETWLRENKDKLGFDDIFVVPGGTRFQIKINGKWSEKMTWHHHENGTDMIPVPSRIHNPELVHSGGVKTVKLGINHLFDY